MWWSLRLLVAAAGVAYIAWTVNWRSFVDADGVRQPGFLERVGDADPAWLAAGLACLLPVVPLAAGRWWVLLRGVGVEVPGRSVLRVTWLGQFFNYAVPVGSTGGDVVRAVAAARWAPKGRKAEAVLSLVADRTAGLAGLVLLAGVVGLTQLDHPVVQRVVWVAWGLVALGLIAVALHAWSVTRRVGLLRRIAGWPGVCRLVEVAEAYRRVKYRPVFAAVGVSTLIHAALAGGAVCAGLALGLDAPAAVVFATVPVAFVAAAMPLTYQGLGVMEAVAVALLGGTAARDNAVVGMLLVHRLYLLAVSLPGALTMLAGSRQAQAVAMPDNAAASSQSPRKPA